MTLYLRLAAIASILLSIYGVYWYIDNRGYNRGRAEIQAKFDIYKGEINEQVAAAKTSAAKIAKAQDDKYQRARADYSDSDRNLNSILDRLRSGEIVPRGEALPVAGRGSDTVPGEAENPTRTADPTEIEAGACEGTKFYAEALKDAAQCDALIEFVR